MALIDDCTHYYKFDESSGDLIDAEGSLDGSVNGCTYGETGIINDSYDFESANSDYISFGSDAFTASVGYSFWFNTDDLGAAGDGTMIYYKGSDNTAVRESIAIVGDEIEYYFSVGTPGSNNQYITTDANLSTGTWYHVVVTGSGDGGEGNYQIWIDGSEKSVSWHYVGDDRSRPTGSDISYMGRDRHPYFTYFNGYLDEFGIFDDEISDADIDSLYNGGDGWAYPFDPLPTGTNITLNINDSFKEVANAYVNVDDAWKEVANAYVNVDDSWKEVF